MGVTNGRAGAPLGLLGGSFDPIHNGHLQLARDALSQLPLGEIRLIPAAHPWQKGAITVSAEHRARMVQLAIGSTPRLALDMHEIERGGVTYTIDTLRSLRAKWPDRPLVLIMGSDQLARFDTWRDWQQIADMSHIAVATRAGAIVGANAGLRAFMANRRNDRASIAECPGGSIVEFDMTPIEISATEVRRLLRAPRSAQDERLAAMIPTAVLDYIHAHHLYRT